MIDQLLLMLVGATLSGVAALFLAYRQAMEGTLKEVRTQRDIYQAIADRAVTRLEREVAEKRGRHGLTQVAPIAPVEPEHQSPITARQEAAAAMATLRARLVAAELAGTLPEDIP